LLSTGDTGVAEASGFMTDLPQSAYLSLSIKRAISAAQQRSHRYVTLEHLLLALLDDPSALEILEGLRADIPAIRVSITEAVNRNLATLYTPGEFDLRASYKVERVLQTASDDAERLGGEEVDAAFVISALARESDNPVPGILKQNGVSYAGAVTWLYANRGTTNGMRSSRSRAQSEGADASAPAAGTLPQPQADADEAADAPPEDMLIAEAEEPSPSDNAGDEPIELDLEYLDESGDESADSLNERIARVETSESEAQPARPAQPAPRKMSQRRPELDWQRPDPSEARPGSGRASARADTDHGWRVDGATARALERRPEPQLPPPSRLDEMRIGQNAAKSRSKLSVPAAPPPAPMPVPGKSRGRKRDSALQSQARGSASERSTARSTRRPPQPHEVLIGRLLENIPRRMRAAVPERVEVRISRDETKTLTRGMEGRSDTIRHDITITQTMSVALRAPDGGFTIEPLSPETQWIFERPDDAETYGRWRWTVTPHHPGQRRLQLIIAARSIGQNGLVGDTALPDQVITIRVRTNYWRTMARGLQWLAAMVLGGVLTELAMAGTRMFQ
jgi:hypothetical protein